MKKQQVGLRLRASLPPSPLSLLPLPSDLTLLAAAPQTSLNLLLHFHQPPVRPHSPIHTPSFLLTLLSQTVDFLRSKLTTEAASYSNLSNNDTYEIRQYAPQLLATYTYPATSKERGDGFRALAGYCGIFSTPRQAQDEKKTAMGMTSPVIMEGLKEVPAAKAGSDVDAMSFFLPAKIKTLAQAPTPTDTNIVVSQLPERAMAAITFSGNVTAAIFEEKTTLLRTSLAKDGIKITSDRPLFAGYNPPFYPAFLKTNEVLFSVDPTTVQAKESIAA